MNRITSLEVAKVTRPGTGQRLVRLAAAIAMAGGLALVAGTGASAATGSGPNGQILSADRAAGLNAEGDSVQVSGAGFDLSKGVYVGVCVNNGPGVVATPCLGGVDTSGGSGSSMWISSNPPAYGQGLAQPYTQDGGKGSFSVALAVSAADELTNCQDPATAPNGCVIVTRADHTRSADRSADVMIPISFGAAEAPASTANGNADVKSGVKTDAEGNLAKTGATAGYYVVGGVLLVGLGTGAVVLTARRRSAK
ncbi:hypothetical protein [Arthrobacter sp.]|uniref:hypothetical protein n=1 Tax=Arthrobacter sp. TaxID=1667 RepID=UPI0026DFBB97|nr:hypothetical protein [Arthrobacter sp.]MDO5754239.1 hypothetical protein [Arthrobacter sp.]